MYPLIWGKIIHNGLTISPSLWPIKYLKPSSLCLNWFTKSKLTGCLDLWNYFLSSLLFYQVLASFHSFLYWDKSYLFYNASFLYWISCWHLFLWYSLILSFSFSDKFLYRFFELPFIASLFLNNTQQLSLEYLFLLFVRLLFC